MTSPNAILPTKDELFFDALAKTGQITHACDVAKLDRRNVYRKKESNAEFSERWDQALETYADALEAAAYRRAVEGTDKGVYYLGDLVATEKQYSDSLLALMLKAKRRREYGDTSKLELTGANGGPVNVEESPTQIARELLFAISTAMRNAGTETAPQHADDGADLA